MRMSHDKLMTHSHFSVSGKYRIASATNKIRHCQIGQYIFRMAQKANHHVLDPETSPQVVVLGVVVIRFSILQGSQTIVNETFHIY